MKSHKELGFLNSEDEQFENNIRPKKIDGFIGQKKIIDNLKTFIASSIAQNIPLDHTIIYGPPGLGKTTLANIVSNHMGSNIKIITGPSLSKKGEISAILTNLKKGDVLFIDEIHRMPITIEETLYSVMEDFKLDIILGEGPAAKSIQIDICPFTLIGATTQLGLLSNPLRSRFGIMLAMEEYTAKDLSTIISIFFQKNNFKISKDSAYKIAFRSRGTPRIALRIAKRVMDFAIVADETEITQETILHAFERLGLDDFGLSDLDHRYLHFIIVKNNNEPVGIETIAAALSDNKRSIEDTLEPFLIREGFIVKTPKGRKATSKALSHKLIFDK